MREDRHFQSSRAAILVEALAIASPILVYMIAAQIDPPGEKEYTMRSPAAITVTLTIFAGIVASWVATRRTPRALLLLLAIFLPTAFSPAEEIFIKMRPTLLYIFVVAVVLWGTSSRQPFLKTLYGEILPLPKRAWVVVTRAAIYASAFIALLNEFIWRTQSTDTWVAWKQFIPFLAFGCLAILLAISIRSSLRVPAKDRLADNGRDARWAVFVDRWMVLSSYSGLIVAPLAIGSVGAYILTDPARDTLKFVGLGVILALSAHSVLCWRHRGIGAGM
jgi:intracellular septation protein A